MNYLVEGKRHLVFDFDQTLFDSWSAHERAFQETFHDLGVCVDYRLISGMKTIDAIDLILSSLNITLDAHKKKTLALRKSLLVREKYISEIVPMPGALDFLRRKRSDETHSIFSSGSEATITAVLANYNLLKHFDSIITAHDVARPKPSPDGLEIIQCRLKVDKSEMILFDDSQSGFDAARAFDIDFVDVNTLPFTSFL